MKILFVDDAPDAVDFRILQLTAAGYEAVPATGGREAINKFREAFESGQPFDLVILDLAMPTVNGFDAAAAMKQIQSDFKFVFLTAYDEPTSAGRSEVSGSLGMWSKPITEADLLANIREVMS